MQPVSSSAAEAIKYERETYRLFITFRRTGETWVYLGVTPETYAALMEAQSFGRFFNAEIRDQYPTHQVSPPKD